MMTCLFIMVLIFLRVILQRQNLFSVCCFLLPLFVGFMKELLCFMVIFMQPGILPVVLIVPLGLKSPPSILLDYIRRTDTSAKRKAASALNPFR